MQASGDFGHAIFTCTCKGLISDDCLQHEDAALAAWLPAWWSQNGASWQAYPSEPESLHEPYHGQDEEDRHLLGEDKIAASWRERHACMCM